MNETQIGNKEIRKQRKKDEKEVSCDELVDDVCDELLQRCVQHILYNEELVAISTTDRKGHSQDCCYSCSWCVWTTVVSWHLE